jgi:hypothetical protein
VETVQVDGEKLSKTQWQDFIKGGIWGSILTELAEREKYLVELFKENDAMWNADTIRGKLTEIEFLRQLPKLIIASILLKEANTENEENPDG